MIRARKVTYQIIDNEGRVGTSVVDGVAEKWVNEENALAFHGEQRTVRIPYNRIIEDIEYNYEPRSFCFISTAVYTNMGFDDDCSDLKTLRYYRDNYLLKTVKGIKMVDNYYLIAPLIVCQIDRLKDKNQIYNDIYKQYLKNIIYLINQNEFESASQKYEKMVDDLLIRYNPKKILINN